MVTALWAVFGALVGLVTVLLLIWYHPATYERDDTVGIDIVAEWREHNRLHRLEVAALECIAHASVIITPWLLCFGCFA
ncbi:MAG: hypothetical protein KJ748_03290 [Gammaproteobacteria bacterium]|nr:hypothetical protein [Gammaproteobacteria bacterium]